MAPELPPKKARQGRLGLPVLVILVAALLLSAVAWWGAELYGVSIEQDKTASEPANTSDSTVGQ